jgi:hypothetical protein
MDFLLRQSIDLRVFRVFVWGFVLGYLQTIGFLTTFCWGFQTDSNENRADLSTLVTPLIFHDYPLNRRKFGSLGATSCSASACHGGPAAGVSQVDAVRGSEYPLWVESDPHARSWRTINSEQSIEILHRLNILVDGKIKNQSAYQNCLACHNTSTDLTSDGIMPVIPEGVGCEACHGPAESWVGSHYQGSASVQSAIENHGMVNTRSELVRAKACTLCHVGGPDRDMNHDIIAAGHPALYFDYNTYLKAYPKHWREGNSSTEHGADIASQRWLIGQITQSDAELELIKSRINKAHPSSIWPEFSNFQCTGCHQSLHPQNELGPPSNPARSTAAQTSGKARVRMWNLDGLLAFDEAYGVEKKQSQSLLKEIDLASSAAYGTTAKLESLAELIQDKRESNYRVLYRQSDMMGRLAAPIWSIEQQRRWAKMKWESLDQDPDWEQAALAYIATIAGSPSADEYPALDRLRSALIFPASTQSPRFPPPNNPAEVQDGLQSTSWSRDISRIVESLQP